MSLALALVDVVLVVSLLVLASVALRVDDLFASCALFIVFGLVMALAWVRLRAPDVALAEAAIGSGITGALLLGALRRLEVPPSGEAAADPPRGDPQDAGGD